MNVPTTLPLAPTGAGTDPSHGAVGATSPFEFLLAALTTPVSGDAGTAPSLEHDADEMPTAPEPGTGAEDACIAALRVLASALVTSGAPPIGAASTPVDAAEPSRDGTSAAGAAPVAHVPPASGPAPPEGASVAIGVPAPPEGASVPIDVPIEQASGGRPGSTPPDAAGRDAADPVAAGTSSDSRAVLEADAAPDTPPTAAASPTRRDVETPAARPSTASSVTSGVPAAELDAAVPSIAPAAPANGTSARAPVDPAVARILDLVAQLEHAPPPRVVVVEMGELRLRLGLDAGIVQLSVIGDDRGGAEEVLREASEALAARGFETDVDGGDRRGDGGGDAEPPTSAPTAAPVRSSRRGGLQL